MRFETHVTIGPGAEYRVMVDSRNEIDEEREDNNSLTQVAWQ